METIGIDHLNLAFPADRLDEVIEYYVDTLGFATEFEDPYDAVADDPGLFRIELGDGYRLFVNPTEEFDPPAANYRHAALRIPTSPAALEEQFEREGLAVDNTAERESDRFGPYTSYYVTDPFGYTIEYMAVGEAAADG